jgi:hypothetical protein
MTPQMNSSFDMKFVIAIAATTMVAVTSSVGAGKGRHSAMDGARIDPSAMLTSAEIVTLPDLTVEQPF